MGNFLRLVGALALIALVASFGLSAVYNATHEITEAYKKAEEAQARLDALACDPNAVFVKTVTDSIVDGEPFVFYTAYKSQGSDEVVGYSFTAYGVGYSSTIVTIVGVDTTGMICGIKITQQKETPGLGSKVQEVVSQNTLWAVMTGKAVDETGMEPWFQKQFERRTVDGLHVVKSTGQEGILAITGATISSKAVTGSVDDGLKMLLKITGIGNGGTSNGRAPTGESAPAGDVPSGEATPANGKPGSAPGSGEDAS